MASRHRETSTLIRTIWGTRLAGAHLCRLFVGWISSRLFGLSVFGTLVVATNTWMFSFSRGTVFASQWTRIRNRIASRGTGIHLCGPSGDLFALKGKLLICTFRRTSDSSANKAGTLFNTVVVGRCGRVLGRYRFRYHQMYPWRQSITIDTLTASGTQCHEKSGVPFVCFGTLWTIVHAPVLRLGWPLDNPHFLCTVVLLVNLVANRRNTQNSSDTTLE